MSEPHKRKRHPKHKTSHRVKNWPEYEQGLRDRGDVTVWFSPEAIEAWTPPKEGTTGTGGKRRQSRQEVGGANPPQGKG